MPCCSGVNRASGKVENGVEESVGGGSDAGRVIPEVLSLGDGTDCAEAGFSANICEATILMVFMEVAMAFWMWSDFEGGLVAIDPKGGTLLVEELAGRSSGCNGVGTPNSGSGDAANSCLWDVCCC